MSTIMIVALLIGLSVSMIAYWIFNAATGAARAEGAKLQARTEALIKRQEVKIARKQIHFSTIAGLNSFLARQSFSKKIRELLLSSGWNVPVSVFLVGTLLWSLLVFWVAYRITGVQLNSAAIAGGTGFIPYLVLVQKRKRYIHKFTVAFPEALLMMKNALKAGQGVQPALRIVGEEGPQPVAAEFARVIGDLELGSRLAEALTDLYKRIGTTDCRIFVLATLIQQEVGGNLAEIFEKVEQTIRARISLAREITVLSSQGKMTGIVLVLMPVVFAIIISTINPDYFHPLLNDAEGKKVLTFAVIMQAIGAVVIFKMTTFKLVN